MLHFLRESSTMTSAPKHPRPGQTGPRPRRHQGCAAPQRGRRFVEAPIFGTTKAGWKSWGDSEILCLVVGFTLKNMTSSVGMIHYSQEMEKYKIHVPVTTKQFWSFGHGHHVRSQPQKKISVETLKMAIRGPLLSYWSKNEVKKSR